MSRSFYVLNGERGTHKPESFGHGSGQAPNAEGRESELLSLTGSYAYKKRKNLSNEFRLGEGLAGQAALEMQRILVRNVPEDYMQVTSTLVEGVPRFVCVAPFLSEDRVKGVIEIGSLHEITDLQLEYLDQALAAVAVSVQVAHGRTELARTLEESQRMSEELQTRQEELKSANEEMEEQTQALQQSEERLKAQQEELQVTNEELKEKTESLERQKQEIEQKAEELAIVSKYKSEFLATMSHELRTPLNSLLILSRSLADNQQGNLTDDQVESVGVIYGSGNDLLSLINEILDLSKIEAGEMDLQMGKVFVQDLADSIKGNFQHMADDKGLSLEIGVNENAPAEIFSDRKRVEQIIINLMSNAVKFTEKGTITVEFSQPPQDVNLSKSDLDIDNALAIAERDTGIGISPDHQKVIFEAFQQVETGTAKRYGGTGLGLSISRELAGLLGGEIQMESEPGTGSRSEKNYSRNCSGCRFNASASFFRVS